ncbi:hypothetical protein Lal_00034385 [Lupinus albus]|uniref:Putative transcription factor bZIP family n=1 Tax=Lupinus albus TaxID=3870 RepID=A0A6A4QVB6_LUPAL|nr:putative transcription factor bZIP family [Lupinus albus]KAF1896686.1 hypothetical protein Lal_00034385 [Lupinus albus]
MELKRLRRILASRNAAAKSRERKIRYAKFRYERELKIRVKKLQDMTADIDEKLAECKKKTAERAALNNRLRMMIEIMRQELQPKIELRQAIWEELQQLRAQNLLLALEIGNCEAFKFLNAQFPPQQPLLGLPPSSPSDDDESFDVESSDDEED